MPREAWAEIKLSEVMDVKHGFAFPGENIREEPPGDVLLTPGNFAVGGGFKGDKFKYFDGHVPEEYVLRENDLVGTMTDLSKQGDTLGYPALVPKSQHFRYLHNQRLGKVVIRDAAKVDKRFISYLLRTREYRHEILASATGATVKHTSPSRILSFKTLIPPLPEQYAIAHVLVSADGLTGSSGFAVLRPRKPEYAQFVYLVATASENIETLSHFADGGAYPAVRPEVVGSTSAIRPTAKVLARFSLLCKPLLAKVARNEQESCALATVRDFLLPTLISGELRLKNTERLVERTI